MGILSWLFGRKQETVETHTYYQNQETNHTWPETFVADDVLNCCEQIGAFEDFGIEDEALINKICEEVAQLFTSQTKTADNLKQSFIQAFSQNGLNVTQSKANLFVSCYVDSYINCM
ncbi:MAG: hypothetical protein J6Q51_03635 [Clostridia bacterium]|nr:hypothetical protein [Clostridia bacterium]